METFLIRALQLIMSLSLLVIIHEGGISYLPVCSKCGWKNSAYSSTLGSLCSSSNQRKAKQNMLSGGCRWVAMSR